METLSKKDYQLIENIMKLTQEELSYFLYNFLRKYYKDKVQIKQDCIIAQGDIPVALAAHMDTVFKGVPKEILYDREKNKMITTDSSVGLGADDRAGVFAIIKIVQNGLRPCIVFTVDEEMGCIGACALADQPCPFDDLRYIIQLDREGAVDSVFYDCDNPNFEDYVNKFGFVTNLGSCSDISALCPSWGMAGVNLSVGYFNNHTAYETLNVGYLLATIKKVQNMLTQENIPHFEYIEAPNSLWTQYSPGWDDEWDYPVSNMRYICHNCGKLVDRVDAFPVKLIKGGTGYYCSNCLCNPSVSWCDYCGKAFETNPDNPDYLCPDCRKSLTKKGKFNGGKRNSSKGRSNEKN